MQSALPCPPSDLGAVRRGYASNCFSHLHRSDLIVVGANIVLLREQLQGRVILLGHLRIGKQFSKDAAQLLAIQALGNSVRARPHSPYDNLVWSKSCRRVRPLSFLRPSPLPRGSSGEAPPEPALPRRRHFLTISTAPLLDTGVSSPRAIGPVPDLVNVDRPPVHRAFAVRSSYPRHADVARSPESGRATSLFPRYGCRVFSAWTSS